MDDSNSKISEDKDAVIRCLSETVESLNETNKQLNESLQCLTESCQNLQEELRQRDREIAELTECLLKLQNKFDMFFAKKSEKQKKTSASEPNQSSEPKEPKKREKNGGGGRSKFPPSLPRRRVDIDVPEEERRCPNCGVLYRCIGEEVTEILNFVPVTIEVVEVHRKKYIAECDCSGHKSITAESPIRAIDKGTATNSLAAAIAVMKYCDHLPLARQINNILRRSGVTLSSSTVCRWMQQIGELLDPLYSLMRRLMLQSSVIKADATTVRYREPSVQGKCKLGYVWGYVGDSTAPFNLYDFRPDGTRSGPEEFLEDYSGYLQVDANTVYDQIFEPKDPNKSQLARPTEVGCWAHARRKFTDALKSNRDAREVISLIAKLYQIESMTRLAAPDVRLAKRQTEAIPLLNKIFDWCRERKDKYAPKELMFLAIQYCLNQESALRQYCRDGRLSIDNNECERALRLAAIGRKNWLFFGSQRGGRTGAVLYSILESAKRHNLNEHEYLTDVLGRLADLSSFDELNDLLPNNWKPVH